MASVTFAVDDELKPRLEKFSWVNWSEAAREALIQQEERLLRWAEVEKIVAKSKMTQEQAVKLSDKVNWAVSKRYKELLKRKK